MLMQSTLDEHIGIDDEISEDLLPIKNEKRHVGPFAYMAMWLGDGFNIGNITVGSSLVVAGVATMNLLQTLVAIGVAIIFIALIFTFNDRFGYKTGAPYVMQLRLSFGAKGAKAASLLRGIPAVVWFGFQSWTGALALAQISKITLGISNVPVCFAILLVLQILLARRGFKSIKWFTSIISTIVMIALFSVFILLLTQHMGMITSKLVVTKGSWGLTLFSFIVAFLGNYTAIFESAADYSRELKPGMSNKYRGFLYLCPILFAYGITVLTGAMLAAVTGISSPVNAMAVLFHNNVITLLVSFFIVLSVMTTNMVANILPPTYVITNLFKTSQTVAMAIVGVLAACSFPWVLVKDSSSAGLNTFIHLYSLFLGPMTAIILIEYYVERRQHVNLKALYNVKNQKAIHWNAPLALMIGAGIAMTQVDLSWFLGFFAGGIAYFILNRVHHEDRSMSPIKEVVS